MSADVLASAPARPRLGHRVELDGIRGLAVTMVVISHVSPRLLPFNDVGIRARALMSWGWLGVDVFFVLSGFLITSLLVAEFDDTARIRVRWFYARRALRLLPALYVFLAAYLVYAWIVDLPPIPTQQSIMAAIFYVTNWVGAWHPSTVGEGLGHLWSLAIEEQFYIVWPAVALAALRLRRGPVGAAGIALLIGIVVVHRIDVFEAGQNLYLEGLVRTDTRIDTLLMGALAGWLFAHGWVPRRGLPVLATLALGGLAWMSWDASPNDAFWYRGGFTLYAALVAVVVLAVVGSDWRGGALFRLAPLRLLGKVSYGLYLWHLPIFKFVPVHAGDWPALVRLAIALALTALAVALSWRLVERPANRRRHRFDPHRAPSEPTPPPSDGDEVGGEASVQHVAQ